MRSLITASLCVVLIFAAWTVFSDFADDTLHDLMNQTEEEIMVSVIKEDWGKAETEMEKLTEKWHSYKIVYSYFLNAEDINNTDYSIARCTQYIRAEDVSNSAGELACVKEQLKYLHLRETIRLENIF